MKIQVTDEMMKHLPIGMSQYLLEDVFAIVERDYEVTGGPVSADVTTLADRDGDTWNKLADGRWVCIQEQAVRETVEQIKREFGPLTW